MLLLKFNVPGNREFSYYAFNVSVPFCTFAIFFTFMVFIIPTTYSATKMYLIYVLKNCFLPVSSKFRAAIMHVSAIVFVLKFCNSFHLMFLSKIRQFR